MPSRHFKRNMHHITEIIRGSEFLDNTSRWSSTHTHIIHQTMKLTNLMKENSWTQTYPRALHVRWSDNDNQRLVGTYYPEFACMYSRLKLIVQKTDVARLMYLHAFVLSIIKHDRLPTRTVCVYMYMCVYVLTIIKHTHTHT